LILRCLTSAIVRAAVSPTSRRRIGWMLGAAGGLAMASLLALAFTLASEPGTPAVDGMPRETALRPEAQRTAFPTTTRERQPAAGTNSVPGPPTNVVRAESGPPPLPVHGPEPDGDRSRRSSDKSPAPILGDD